MNKFRSHNCSELTEKDNGKKVILSGWLHRKKETMEIFYL